MEITITLTNVDSSYDGVIRDLRELGKGKFKDMVHYSKEMKIDFRTIYMPEVNEMMFELLANAIALNEATQIMAKEIAQIKPKE